jgi:hypothetical protein
MERSSVRREVAEEEGAATTPVRQACPEGVDPEEPEHHHFDPVPWDLSRQWSSRDPPDS